MNSPFFLKKSPNEITVRAISALIMAFWGFFSAWFGGFFFALTWIAVSFFVGIEWFTMTRNAKSNHSTWYLLGIFYALALVFSVCLLRFSDAHGLAVIFYLFAIVWSFDVCAFFVGRAVGGPKLAPRISPKKTWSGLVGGIVGAVIVAFILLYLMGYALSAIHGLLAFFLALISAGGDLMESQLKREFGVKDSSQIIPGHGGFMDRLDGFIIAAVAAAFIGVCRGGFSGVGAGVLIWP